MLVNHIPGEPSVVAAGASELDEVAATLLRLAATLDLVADEDVTIGDSVDAMRVRTKDASGALREAHPRYTETASALHEFAIRLEDVQTRFSQARSTIDSEADSIRYYEREIWEIQSQDIMLALTIPDPAQQAADAKRLAWLRSELSQHRAAQAAAQSALESAVSDWNTAAEAAAGRIRPALGQLNDGFLDFVGSLIGGIGDFLAGVAEWIAKILDTVLTTILLIVMVVVAIVVMLAAIVVLFPVLLALLASGAMSLDEIVEVLIGITLVVVPLLTAAVALLMLREALTPTPKVTPVAPAGGRLVQKGDHTDYEYLFDRNGMLDEQGGKDNTVVEIVQVLDEHGAPVLDENGNPVWRVTLPSTQDWQLGMGGAFGDNGAVNDLGSNLALILAPEMQGAYERAVTQAMLDAGIGPDDPVMLTGWSQGGILAGAMASDPSSPFNIEAIVVAGAPIDHMPIPRSVSVVAIQHDGDHVPRLDGVPPHQGPNWVTITEPSSGIGYPHNAGFYADTAAAFDTDQSLAEYPTLPGIREEQSIFFSDNEVAYQYEFAEADTAIS